MTTPIIPPVPELRPEVWPRWLPAPNLRDPYTHYTFKGEERSICGAEIMWAKVGHPTTERPQCPRCQRVVEP